MLTEQQKADARAGVQRAKENFQSFDMSTWSYPDKNSPCGTTGCYAFEVTAANGVPVNQIKFTDFGDIDIQNLNVNEEEPAFTVLNKDRTIWPLAYAKNLLKIGNDPDQNSDAIFYVGMWPNDLEERYRMSPESSLERVLILEEAVERWIAGDGRFPEKKLVSSNFLLTSVI